MKSYFITGATGVIGSAISAALLSRTDARLKLLVRANSTDELAQRKQCLLTYWGAHAQSDRIEILQGDTTQPLLGLEQSEFDRVAGECTHLIHCAAMVRMNLPIEEARNSALKGAEGLIHLARACQHSGQLKKIEIVSTVGVGGRLAGTLPERWITESRAFHNTYEQAKAEAEDYLRGPAGADLPITIHRPSMVVGDSVSGRVMNFQIFYHLIEFVSGLRTFGMLPDFGDTRLDIVPVDYVADAIVWSSTDSEMIGKTLHLCSGPDGAILLRVLRQRVRDHFSSMGRATPVGLFIPTRLFRLMLPFMRLVVPLRLRRAIGTLPIFFDYLDENQTFSNTDTKQLLAKHGIQLPSVDAYLDRVLSYYLRHRLAS